MSLAGFQQSLYQQPPPGKPGDFAGTNPRAFVEGPSGAYVSDGTVVVGQFAWANPATGLASVTYSANALLGFVHAEDQAIIPAYLGFDNVTIQAGFPVTLANQGDFWCNFAAPAANGALVYAIPGTGAATTTSSSNYATSFFVVGGTVAAASVTASATASVGGIGVMTVSAVGSGTLVTGQQITGTGVPANTFITGQTSGTTGGTGTYTLSNNTAFSSTTVTASQGTISKISSWQT